MDDNSQDLFIARLGNFFQGRDFAESKLKKVQALVEEYEKKGGVIRQEIETLPQEMDSELEEGKDLVGRRKKIRAKEADLEDIQGVISRLKETSIPVAANALKVAQDELENAVDAGLEGIKPEFNAEFNLRIGAGMQVQHDWVKFRKNVAEKLRVKSSASSATAALRLDRDDFKNYLQNLYGLKMPGEAS